jgi:hypothetical protein
MHWAKQIFFLSAFFLSTVSAQSKETLDFSVRIAPVVQSPSQSLAITITIKNVGLNAIYVYKDLDYLVNSFARTDSGQDLPRKFVEEVRPPPPKRDSFVLLMPGNFLVHTRQLSLDDLGVSSSGKYRIGFWYNSHFSPSFTYGLRVWNGSLSALESVEVLDGGASTE